MQIWLRSTGFSLGTNASPIRRGGWKIDLAYAVRVATSRVARGGTDAHSTLRANEQRFSNIRLRRARHRTAADLGARTRVPDPRRARCVEAHDLVGCRRPALDRQWPRRGGTRIAAHGRNPGHHAGHQQCRAWGEARYPAGP